MKFPVSFLAVLAGLIASFSCISEAAKDGDSEMERIVGGRKATEGQYPFACALYRDGQFICTCSIIGESTVLTAAHCVVNNGVTGPAGSFFAIANLNRTARAVRIEFESITPHPDYSESGIRNDIAVFRTRGVIPLANNVAEVICIARKDTAPREYSNVTAMGWGNTRRRRDSEMERIVGGRKATEGQYPFACALYRDGQFICTCSIIGESTVLTAAHCVVNNGVTGPAGSFFAIANLNRTARAVRIEFESITPHPDYSESGIRNDIAVFRTRGVIPLANNVAEVICIARKDTAPREYSNVTAMGWGNTRRRPFVKIPDILKYVEQRVVGTLECRLAYFGSRLEDYKICAGDFFSGICNGDSGGPLIFDNVNNRTRRVQIGVASYGNAITGCGFITPSVWTRTSSFYDFIKQVAAGDSKLCEV